MLTDYEQQPVLLQQCTSLHNGLFAPGSSSQSSITQSLAADARSWGSELQGRGHL